MVISEQNLPHISSLPNINTIREGGMSSFKN
jgi:hypothetical protein